MARTDSLVPYRETSKTEQPSSAASTKFPNNVCDDLLSEILVRLDFRSAIRCSSICKRLFSLISSPQYIRSFVNRKKQQQQQQRNSDSLPFLPIENYTADAIPMATGTIYD
ncbi:hypothetical protein TIFTF001_035947 [Ficus carica]|uniref:F-box domain-containing protein n=1 Tax=Ficus carica TaxID=3494 RepID=A0AA88E3A3_FICCA|nr:hypothetical protein TIFTF001_035947 [Ficus carica]